MKFKSIVQTRWKIEPECIKIYPYGVIYFISIMIAVTWGGWLLFLGYILDSLSQDDVISMYPLHLIYLSIVTLLWLFARTAIVFDNRSHTMYKRLFGFITTTVIPFNKLAAILPVMNVRAAYQYRVFSKDDNSGSGTTISSPFLSESSPHAIEFKSQVLTTVQKFIKAHH